VLSPLSVDGATTVGRCRLCAGAKTRYGSEMLYEQPPITSPFEPGTGKGMLRPEDVTSHTLPVVMRGYDREQVERFLDRVSEAYLLTWRQGIAVRGRLRSLEEELQAAQGEAEASARSVAELTQRCATAEDQLSKTREARNELSAKFDLSERERKQALTSLGEASQRASDLEEQLQAYGSGQHRQEGEAEVAPPAVTDAEAATLLIAATRAAEDVRRASRERALHTLTKAREQATQLHAEAERQRAALAEMQERREQAEHEADEILVRARAEAESERAALAEVQERREQAEHKADEILVRARAEADRVVTAIDDERHRVRELLTGALASLDPEGASREDDLMTDLSSRLNEPAEASGTES